MAVELRLGVKSDMIEYRYSHQWLFRLLAEEGVRYVQLGSQFETYQLPDEYFHDLRKQADDAGVVIDSTFTTHRELGGFLRSEPGFEQVARKSYERYIEVGGILGATSVGSNPGAVLRDQMGTKQAGVKRYIRHMKELMHHAHEHGLKWLTVEPMSCLAEPPTLPEEIAAMGQELTEYHNANPDNTVQVGYCTDIAHGYADRNGKTIFDQYDLFEACVPWMYEVHLKNTDSMFNSTFGFTQADRDKGIIDVPRFRQLLVDASDRLPVATLAGYLEIGGPKLGRDYSDHQLEASLRESLQYLQTAFMQQTATGPAPPRAIATDKSPVMISPSMMCVDPLNFESALRRVEALGVDMLHIDIMDGHFVPNAPMGLGILEALGPKTALPIDVHLMVANNDFFVELLAPMRVDQVSVHVESCTHLDRTLARIREIGAKVGVAINPATPLSAIEYVLERIDYVLVMTVNPGYAGQKMTPASIRKIADCRKMLDDRGYGEIPIQVDGNVSFENIPAMVRAGGVNLVAGTSSIFHRDAPWSENVEKMKQTIAAGLAADCQ
ncbi:Ribulose-phosphate 3-epimerase [Rosistilla ulvae]|uniref:Ribulose-phosphate 3-epimerase n=1 Tax=Rosistilla ulvae TaxID=1930277 RepID=A0A517M122_9BACT|nr:ribulose-phosphate 3-epimerase [Rosistilla ulvae]QDS88580.1 Ribulose-phosphate 3-epimerase [Rosistilla ulvae]